MKPPRDDGTRALLTAAFGIRPQPLAKTVTPPPAMPNTPVKPIPPIVQKVKS